MTLVDRIEIALLNYYFWERYEASDTLRPNGHAKKLLRDILSDPSIVEIEVGAELPVWKMAKERDELGNAVYRLAQQDMIDDGWVKKKKDGGKK